MPFLYFHSEAAARHALRSVNLADMETYYEYLEPGPCRQALSRKLSDLHSLRPPAQPTSPK